MSAVATHVNAQGLSYLAMQMRAASRVTVRTMVHTGGQLNLAGSLPADITVMAYPYRQRRGGPGLC